MIVLERAKHFWLLKQNDLPIPSKELHDLSNAHTKIGCTIHNFSLIYDKNNIDKWTSENKKWLMSDFGL